MSGGHWNYAGYAIEQALTDIANDPNVQVRWPKAAIAFKNLAMILYEIEHDMDWDLSGDSYIEADAQFDDEVIKMLQEAIYDLEE